MSLCHVSGETSQTNHTIKSYLSKEEEEEKKNIGKFTIRKMDTVLELVNTRQREPENPTKYQ